MKKTTNKGSKQKSKSATRWFQEHFVVSIIVALISGVTVALSGVIVAQITANSHKESQLREHTVESASMYLSYVTEQREAMYGALWWLSEGLLDPSVAKDANAEFWDNMQTLQVLIKKEYYNLRISAPGVANTLNVMEDRRVEIFEQFKAKTRIQENHTVWDRAAGEDFLNSEEGSDNHAREELMDEVGVLVGS